MTARSRWRRGAVAAVLTLLAAGAGAGEGPLRAGQRVRLLSPGRLCETPAEARLVLRLARMARHGGSVDWAHAGDELGWHLDQVCRDRLDADESLRATGEATEGGLLLAVRAHHAQRRAPARDQRYWVPAELLAPVPR